MSGLSQFHFKQHVGILFRFQNPTTNAVFSTEPIGLSYCPEEIPKVPHRRSDILQKYFIVRRSVDKK